MDSSIHGADTCDDTYTGHTRPMIHLAARIVKLRPVTLTMLTTDSFYERVKIELSRSFDGNEEEYATRLRSVILTEM